ncbi:MAG: pantoate--beta-alanine ligase [Proteobacteria bacterium]|nr:pantoate--beta-alanine ligase [Pseudomonadota bacterium]
MKTIEKIDEMASLSRSLICEKKKIAFVPTMGFLHKGHLSLIKEGKKRGVILVVSIFVNPTQFGHGEDFDIYPRDLARDKELLNQCGVDILFLPSASDMYSEGNQTVVDVTELSQGLCGDSRPGHFRGVTTIVAKLFNIVNPHIAIFGEKDFQQLAVIKKMVKDLDFNIEIIGMPIVREDDGLAMSSRNHNLSPEERAMATSIYQSLKEGYNLCMAGEKNAQAIINEAKKVIASGIEIDYLEIRDSETLLPVEKIEKEALFAIAAKVGKTRLIDNAIIGRK